MVLNRSWRTIGGIFCLRLSLFPPSIRSGCEYPCTADKVNKGQKQYPPFKLLHPDWSQVVQTYNELFLCSFEIPVFTYLSGSTSIQMLHIVNRDSGDIKVNVTAPLSVVYLYFTRRSKIHPPFTKLSKAIHDNVATGNESIVLQG